MYQLIYHPKIKTVDIPKLSETARRQIKLVIEQRLIHSPEKFGLPLRRSLKGYRKLRVGDYRVVYAVEDNMIRVLIIGHRKDVYTKADARS